MYTDNHNHTKFYSSDATMSVEELVDGCKTRGINRIAITEHYDMDYPHKDDVMVCDLDSYTKSFSVWSDISINTNGPELLMGIELGYQSGLANRIDDIASKYSFDTVLLSNHIFRGSDVYFSEECYKLPKALRHKEYINMMAEMCDKVSNYDIVTHYDYIDRYNKDINSSIMYEDCPKAFDDLFEIMIYKDKSLEINTRSIEARKNRNPALIMPDSKIIRRYLDMGGKFISLGSDSHNPSTLGINFKETAQYLKTLGVNELVYFKNRKPNFESIN